ncbi:NAD(P)H dehydrogenase (quinone) [Halolactibacillus halophilus]|uniref:Flavoprotein n=1 Tax=Halolactibacillus halophilus TaxID=306540 RepID=A0A1I5RJ21_9BACI|nr:NAD(P)H-dependent oxidoreductase [Halolactibacillus halophilus]GEM02827.1 flavoprotein [Halolactibacillus halophilus]SFP58271.1 NAD(P)H dehydrogenase (quinone) [Halolactibacillus halophilus]
MKALVIFAHPRKESFSHALLERVTSTLNEKQYDVTVRDLYAMDFNPILDSEDTIHIEGDQFVRESNHYPPDVQIEMSHLLENDLYIFIFPSWWNGMPAIMKGYIDRVCQHGFFYSFEDKTVADQFKGKRALFFTPTGQPQMINGEENPLTAAMRTVTSGWLFNANAIDVIDHTFYGRVPYMSRDELELYLQDAEEKIRAL